MPLWAQGALQDSSTTDSLQVYEEEDERDRPLGDTTAIFFSRPLLAQPMTAFDTSLNDFESPQWQWQEQEAGDFSYLGHLGTARQPLIWAAKQKLGFRTGLDAWDVYRLSADAMKVYQIGRRRPFTNLYFSQINLQNTISRASFAHQISPRLYYSIQYGMLNYEGYYNGHRSRHQDIGVHVRYQHKNYQGDFHLIDNANNQQENGGIRTDTLGRTDQLFLSTLAVQLAVNSTGSPKNENRHQGFRYRQFLYNSKVDSNGKATKANRALGHQIHYQNSRYKYFDVGPASDSSFYETYQVNNRGIRHYLRHQYIENKLFYQQALGGNLQKATLIFEAYAGHRWNFVGQEPDDFQVQNLLFGGRVYGDAKAPLQYWAEGHAATSRLGLDFSLRGRLGYRLKDWLMLEGETLLQRYEPAQIARKMYLTQSLIWNQEGDLTQEQDFSLYGRLRWPRFWGSFELANHTITNPVYFDSLVVARQYGGSANILQLSLQQDIHIWKFHLENQLCWQRVLAGGAVYRLPELVLRHKLYFESRVFKTTLLRVGANMRFMTGYRANAYAPWIGQFYVQDEQSLNFYPRIDVYLSAKIWQMRFFVNAENFSYYLWNEQNYFDAPYYPQANWLVRMGLSWQLFD